MCASVTNMLSIVYRILLSAYSIVHILLWPWLVLRLWWRGRRAPEYRQRWAERWGWRFVRGQAPVIWIHAVSVGESVAAKPLIARLKRHYPDHQILVTTTTPTGSARIKADWGDQVLHQYLPYDAGVLARRFLRVIRPVLAIFVETEVWPNYVYWANRYGIPTVLANARLSWRSARGYARILCLLRPAFASFSLILAASRADARRFVKLGARPEVVHVCGNIKFDVKLPEALIDMGRMWRQKGAPNRPTLMLASSHEPEEGFLITLVRQLYHQVDNLLVIWVPRHPERFEAVAHLCRENGLKVARRSELAPGQALSEAQVLLGDSMGEMAMYYCMADVALVCGSLAPIGGHNPLEPIAAQCVVASGPHVFNFAAVFRALTRIDAVALVSVDTAASTLMTLLTDEAKRQEMKQRAHRWLLANQGAADRMFTKINKLLSA